MGPAAFSCWGLLRHVYSTQRGVELPVVQGYNFESLKECKQAVADTIPLWTPLQKPTHLCAVALSMSTSFVHHVGVYLALDGGVILHCHERSGVVIQSPSALRAQGWKRIEFYDYCH